MTNDPWNSAAPPPPPPPEFPQGAAWPGAGNTTEPKIGHGVRIFLASSLLVVAVAGGVLIGHSAWTTTESHGTFQFPRFDLPGGGNFTFPSPNSGSTSGGPKHASAIEERVDPAVVDVASTFKYQGSAGEGTGIVLTADGEVLTNNHVVEGATTVSVTDIGNGKTYAAKVVGYDRKKDLAVIQLEDASGLRTVTTGDSATLSVGEAVLAIGNAGGVGGTPSAAGGTITALHQSITASDSLDGTSEQLAGLIATNADVIPGDSGGPLVNASGQVVGIDTAGSASQGFQFSSQRSAGSQGYAIPIDQALTIASEIEAGSGSTSVHVGATAFLGVLLSTSQTSSGVLVQSTVSGGAAANAGIVAGDVVTSIDGTAVNTPEEIANALFPLHPGEVVNVKGVAQDGHAFTLGVTLASGPPA
jgi:S1-C subfamily serine protease